MRQVSLWSQPEAFAVKGAGGVSWCEALSGSSQAPRMLCLDYFFFPCFLGFVLSPGSGLSPGSDPQYYSTGILWRASCGWSFYSISFCNCQSNVTGRAGNREAPGEWNAFLCVICQILKCFRSCCMVWDLILNVEVYAIKYCVTFLTGQGSLLFWAVVFRWLLSTGLMRFLPRPWVMRELLMGQVWADPVLAFWVLLRHYIADLQGNLGESVEV